MSMYAVSIGEDGTVTNRYKVASEDFAKQRGWIVSDTAAKGDHYDGDSFTRPQQLVEQEAEQDAAQRAGRWLDMGDYGSGQNGTDFTKLQRVVEKSEDFDRIWIPPFSNIDAGANQIFLKRQSHLFGNRSVIAKTKDGGSIIRSAKNGDAPHLHQITLDAGGHNSTAVVFFQGCVGGSMEDVIIRRPSHAAVSVMTAPGGERVCGFKAKNVEIENPQDDVTHLFDVNATTGRVRGQYIDIDGLKITGADPANLPDIPEQYVEGGSSPPDMLRIAGMDDITVRNYRGLYSGAAIFSIAVRGAAECVLENVYGEQAWESGNVGSGAKLAFVADPESIAPRKVEGETVRKMVELHNSDGTVEPGQMRVDSVMLYAEKTYEVRLSAMAGQSQFDTPKMGQYLVPVGERPEVRARVLFGRPSALNVELENVHMIDTGIKHWKLPEEERFSIYAAINVTNAENVRVSRCSARLYRNPAGFDRFLVASRSDVRVSQCSPSIQEAPEMYEATAGGSITSVDHASDGLWVGHGGELEVDGAGQITPTHTHHKVDSNHGLAGDDVRRIDTNNMQMGDTVTFGIATTLRPVRFQDSGTLLLMERDVTLVHPADRITFVYRGTPGQMEFESVAFNGSGASLV